MASVRLSGVTKRFGDTIAVDGVDLEVSDQEFLVLLGPSGCGKSTLLRLIAGLEEPTEGEISIGDRVVNDVPPARRDVAMVFQNYALYPHRTAAQNIEVPLRSRKVPTRERVSMVAEAARALAIEDILDRKPAQLSGGQRQRVALARAIVRRPAVFLMDEPLSNLDAGLRVQTRGELVGLHGRLDATFIYVTHDQVEAMTMADRIVVLDRGRIVQVGTPGDVYDRPATRSVARFIGSPPMNVLGASVVGPATVKVTGAELNLGRPLPDPLPREVELGIRPEHVDADPDGLLEATVTLVEALGHEHVIHCDLAGLASIALRRPAGPLSPEPGDQIRIRLDPSHLHLFDPGSGARLC